MKYRKVMSIFIILVSFIFIFAGCKSKKSEKTIIFVPQMANDNGYWDGISENIEKKAKEAGYEYKVMGPEEWNLKEQVEVLDKAIDEKPSAIVLAPIGSTDLFPDIKKANELNIPVILIDNNIDRKLLDSDECKVATYVGISNYDGGVQIADKLAEKLSSGDKVAILRGEASSKNGEDRCDGFYDEIEKKGMSVVAEIPTQGSKTDAYSKAKLLLEAYPDLNGVFAVNKDIFIGFEKAASEKNIEVIAGTFDCDDNTKKLLQDGKLLCTFDQNSEGMSTKVIEVIDKLINGEKVEEVSNSEGKIIE